MWFLTKSNSGAILYIKKIKTSIGRLGCDFELTGDESISRKHAFFTLTDDGLTLEDGVKNGVKKENSKYGTFLNDNGTKSGKLELQPVVLKDGDTIRFGMFANEWVVHQLEQKTAFSSVDTEMKSKVVKILDALKVQHTETFDGSCTHLTMPAQSNVTIKLLQALSSCVPVVTTKFWVELQKSIANDQPLPKCSEYEPKVSEQCFVTPDTISLTMRVERKKLFAGKTFIFVSGSKLKEYQEIIKNAGGKCSSLSQTKLPTRDYCVPNTIMVRDGSDTSTQTQKEAAITKLNAALSLKKRRMVQESEIGLAILHCSMERFCNPNIAIESLFKPSESTELRITKSKTLVPNTESMNFSAPTTSRKRGRPKKTTPQQIVESINLDSDEEVTVDGTNKENIPSAQEMQASVSNVSISETQVTTFDTPIPDVTPIENLSIPETQASVVAKENTSVTGNSGEWKNCSRATHETDQQSFITAASKASSASISTTSLFNFSNSLSSNSSRPQRKRKNSENADEVSSITVKRPTTSSTPMDDSNLFSFTDVSGGKENSNAQRKSPESIDVPGSSKERTKDQNPKSNHNKKSSSVQNVSDDDDEVERPARKRTAEAAMGNLFSFNMNFVKKKRQNESESQEPTSRASGIVPFIKPPKPVTKLSTYGYESDESCDSGVWLSKAMTSLNFNKSAREIKSELPEPDSSSAMEDIKPQLYVTLFSVLESSIDTNSTSSMVSKRKQYVKKKNYKSQSSIVTMKVLNVDDTHEARDDF